MFLYVLAHLLVIIILVATFWIIINYFTLYQLRKTIEKEGYFERFNTHDIKVRNGLTLDAYIRGCRIPFPWERYNYPPNTIFFEKTHEGGNPHTHGHYIMLPKSFVPSDTLIKHEEMHIYQRYHPLEVNQGRTILSMASMDTNRANPDTNCLQYAGYSSKYKDDPRSLSDIVENPARDHPYEDMAYSVT